MKKGPEAIGEIISRLFTARGWGRRQERLGFESAWAEVVGAKGAKHTQVGSYRRKVLEILVDNAVLLQELANFQKRELLEKLRIKMPNVTIADLRFRTGGHKK